MYRADNGQLANGHLQNSQSILGGAHLGRGMKSNYCLWYALFRKTSHLYYSKKHCQRYNLKHLEFWMSCSWGELVVLGRPSQKKNAHPASFGVCSKGWFFSWKASLTYMCGLASWYFEVYCMVVLRAFCFLRGNSTHCEIVRWGFCPSALPTTELPFVPFTMQTGKNHTSIHPPPSH